MPAWRRLTFRLFLFVVLPLTALVIAVLLSRLTLHGQAMRMLVGERNARRRHQAIEPPHHGPAQPR